MERPRNRRLERAADAVLLAAAFGTSAAVVLGFFGSVLPLFDTIGQFRAHAALSLVPLGVALAIRRYLAAGLASLSAAALGIHAVLPFMLASSEPSLTLPPQVKRYSLLQMNLRFDTEDKATTLKRIDELRPDIVTVQEMTGAWNEAFQTIRDRYPYQQYCASPDEDGDVALLSQRPFVATGVSICDVEASFAARSIDFDGKIVVIGSQHLRWPWPGRQWRQIDRLIDLLGGIAGPRLVGGDFNSAPWTASVHRYAQASGTAVAAGIGPTFRPIWLPAAVARWVGLPIDNILASPEVVILQVSRPEATASDHLPVLVTFALPSSGRTRPRSRASRDRITADRSSGSCPSAPSCA